MKSRAGLILGFVLAAVSIIGLCATWATANSLLADDLTPTSAAYLPIAYKQPTPTATSTPRPTSTPSPPPPVTVGSHVRFKAAFYDQPFEGVVTSSGYRTSLYDSFWNKVYHPGGIFVVVIMNVTNHGTRSDEVGYYCFAVRDSASRTFDLAEIDVQFAAEDEYNRDGVYTTIQPGFTRSQVFVFDVLPQSQGLHLVSLDPW